MEISNLTIKSASELLKTGELKVKDLVNAYVTRAKEKNPELNAFLEIYSENFINEQVEKAQKRIDSGEGTLLTGIPLGIKDNILIEGQIASAASKILENYTATYTATAAQKLMNQGVVFIGRTNQDEFAMGGSTENSAYGPTKNAFDPERVAGGSSGGSAVAVAADMVIAALGSDTGGSIRQPASFNGVVGLKPTYGSVSRHGLMAMGSSLDVIGPITKTVGDAEILYEAIKGKDSLDSTTVKGDGEGDEAKIIGVPRAFLKKGGIDETVLKTFEDSLEKLEKDGYKIVDVSLPNLDYSLAVYYVLMPAEVSSNMARYDGIKYGGSIEGKDLIDGYFKTRGELLGDEVRRRILLGTYVLSAGYADSYYNKAWHVRNLIKKDFEEVFEEVDIIALPTAPTSAFKIGEKTSDPLQMYLEDIFTVFANLIGVPSISVPAEEKGNLPIGIQFVAPHLSEQRLFILGQKFERIG